MSTTTKMITPPPKNRYRITVECNHCDGAGETEVNCFDCGEDLFTDNIGEDPDDDICKECAAARAEEAAEAAQVSGHVPPQRTGRR